MGFFTSSKTNKSSTSKVKKPSHVKTSVVKRESHRPKQKSKFLSLFSKKTKTSKIAKVRSSSNNRIEKKESIKPYQVFFDFRINHDKKMMFVFFALILVGIIAIFSSTIVFAYRYQDDKYYYLLSHLRFLGIGFVALLIFYFVRLEFLTRLWFVPYGIVIGLLGYLFYLSLTTSDVTIDGANRWLLLGGFQFQPSEFSKLAFLVFVAGFLSTLPDLYRDAKDYFWKNFAPFGGAFFLVVLLILLGRNLGTALVVGFIGMACYFVAANTKFQKAGFAVFVILIAIGGLIFGIYESYRADRIEVWTTYLKTGDTLVEEEAENGETFYSRELRSYQFDQVLTACGTGGLWGQGLGQSIGKYYFVKTTAGDDSIICIIGEELGFPITAAIILLYIYLVYVCLNLSQKLVDKPVPYYILVGFACWIGFQMFVHVGANLGVIPLTGQTLPFISLGGSSIISAMAGMGLALNASKQV